MFQDSGEFYSGHMPEYGFEKVLVLEDWTDKNSENLIQIKNQALNEKNSNMVFSKNFTYERDIAGINYLVLAFKYESVSKLCLIYEKKTENNI